MKGIILILILCFITGIKCQRTVADVCTANRTKPSFCSIASNCGTDGKTPATNIGVILCLGTNIGQTFNCSSAEPYCAINERGDSCTSSNPCSGGGSGSSSFTCTATGYYPDPKNCSSYYFCTLNVTGSVYIATQYNCPSGNNFSPSSGSFCTRQNSFNCIQCTNCCQNSNTTNYYQITYGTNKQYYGLCVPGAGDPLIFACPANSQPNLSYFPATCEYRCWRVGFFENTLDNTKYFECYLNNFLRFESIERQCPQGSKFDSQKSQCAATVQAKSLMRGKV